MSEPLDALKNSVRQVRFFGFRSGVPEGDIPESFRVVRKRDELLLTMRTDAFTTPETLAQRWRCRHETRALSLEDIFVEISQD